MKILFLEESQLELDDTIDYYNIESEGLGDEFLQEVLNSLDRIVSFKDAWHPLTKNIRRCQTKRFPYGLIYAEINEGILIISVSHLHRKPNHWKNRKTGI